MKILITGGAGFIGSHITKLLLDIGHSVTVYDNLSKGYLSLVDQRAEFIEGNISDTDMLVQALNGIDCVIHMAGYIEIPLSVKEPINFAENNVMGSLHLFEAMVQAEVKKVIFSSTAAVYGDPANLPLTEQEPLSATNPYAASKIAVEAFLSSYHALYQMDVTILRYFNPYGPNELHKPETHAIPNFIESALKDKELPLYWGGEQVRDFIYVEDLASAHTTVLGLPGFNVFNVGSEEGVEVKKVVDTISKLLGKELKIKDLRERLGDVPANYASSKLLEKATGWRAKYSLEAGLEKTIEWFKKNPSTDTV